MALELNICRTATTADCGTVTITDQTGNYDAVDNVGGYGTPNPDRADLALFLMGWKWVSPDEDDPEDVPLTINNDDPLNVTSWDIAQTIDGYYYYKIFGVPVWDVAVAYTTGDVVYDSTYQAYYKALQGSTGSQPGATPLDWEVVENLLEEEDNDSIYLTDYNDVVYCRAEACVAKILSDYTDQCCKKCDGYDICKQWIQAETLFQSALVNSYQEKWAESDYILRYLADLCSNVDCSVC